MKKRPKTSEAPAKDEEKREEKLVKFTEECVCLKDSCDINTWANPVKLFIP